MENKYAIRLEPNKVTIEKVSIDRYGFVARKGCWSSCHNFNNNISHMTKESKGESK